jgi:hypothetical protein
MSKTAKFGKKTQGLLGVKHILNSFIFLPLENKCTPITRVQNVLVKSDVSNLKYILRIYP